MSITAAAGGAIAAKEAMPLIGTLVSNLPDLYREGKSDNLIEYTKNTRNDFLTLIEDDLLGLPYLPDIMQATLSSVSGYFLSAVSLIVDIPGVEINKTLGKLNVSRDPMEAVLGAGSQVLKAFGTESWEFGLPDQTKVGLECFSDAGYTYGAMNTLPSVLTTVGCEDQDDKDEADRLRVQQLEGQIEQNQKIYEERMKQMKSQRVQNNEKAAHDRRRADAERAFREEDMRLKQEMHDARISQMEAEGASKAEMDKARREQMQAQAKDQRELDKLRKQQLRNQIREQEAGSGSVGFGKGTIDTLKEVTNLSVGKVLDVTIEKNGNRATIPVTINLAVTNTDAQSVRNILTFNSDNMSFRERYYRYKAGELTFVKDLLWCQDMRDEARRARIKDKSGFLDHMMRRNNKNWLSSMLGMSASLNNASAVLVFSENTARDIEIELGGKLDRFKIREQIFKNTAAMIMCVVDTKWDVVRFYHRSIDTYTELSARELKRSAKGGGADVEDILRAYSAGTAPAL